MNKIGRFRTLEVSDPAFEVEGLRHITVHSPALDGRADITVWSPDAPGPLPIAILLHGVYGSHWAWTGKAGLHRTARRLVADGKIAPMVLAMPSDGLWEDGSGYLALPGRDTETWIIEEVVEAVEAAVPAARASAGVCIGGLSMGGFGALRLGALHPERFSAVSAHSSLTSGSQLTHFTDVPLSAYAVTDTSHQLADILLSHRDQLPPMRFDCGVADFLMPGNRELHHELVAAGVEHGYAEFPGGHEWSYWAEHIVTSLMFFSDHLTERPGASR